MEYDSENDVVRLSDAKQKWKAMPRKVLFFPDSGILIIWILKSNISNGLKKNKEFFGSCIHSMEIDGH